MITSVPLQGRVPAFIISLNRNITCTTDSDHRNTVISFDVRFKKTICEPNLDGYRILPHNIQERMNIDEIPYIFYCK